MFPSVLFLVYFLFCQFLLSKPPDRISQYVKRAADEDNIVFIRLFHRLFQSICHAPRYLVLRPDFLPVNHFTDFFRRPCPRCRRGAGINLVPFSYEHLNNGFRRFYPEEKKKRKYAVYRDTVPAMLPEALPLRPHCARRLRQLFSPPA